MTAKATVTAGAYRFVQLAGCARVRSAVTGREILVNPHVTSFLVPPTFASAGMDAAAAAWEEHVAGLDRGAASNFQPIRALLAPVLAARSPRALAAAMDVVAEALIRTKREGGVKATRGERDCTKPVAFLKPGEPARVFDLVAILSRHGCLMLPAGDARTALFFGRSGLPPVEDRYVGSATTAIEQVVAAAVASGKSPDTVRGTMIRLALVMHGVVEVGDVDRQTLAPIRAIFDTLDEGVYQAMHAVLPVDRARCYGTTHKLASVLRAVHAAQVVAYGKDPDRAERIPASYHDLRKGGLGARQHARRRHEVQDFAWIPLKHPTHVAWQQAALSFLATKDDRVSLQGLTGDLHLMLRALLATPDVPATPRAFCADAAAGAPVLRSLVLTPGRGASRLRALTGALSDFFDFVIRTEGRRADGTLDPSLGNPADLLPEPGRDRGKGQTHRLAMPPWLIRKVREVIEGDDFAWPRTRRADHVPRLIDGVVQDVWSPVLAELVLLRFMIPLRALQSRLLGSGEGDAHVWEVPAAAGGEGRWVENTSVWRPPAGDERAHGFVRRIWDPDRAGWVSGLYVNTNKTQDRASGYEDLGYEIPWTGIDGEVLALYERVMRFQVRHNPPRAPKSRAELVTELALTSPAVAARLPKLHYLFRDAANPDHPDEPPTRGRVRSFWMDLLEEVESRLRDDPDGPRNEDGSPLVLITKREKGGKPLNAVFDLHSVRVSGITALAMAGCPLQVLVMLAGHATWVMTLYYVKPSAADVHRALDAATERMGELESQSWEDWLAGADLPALRALVVANSDAATVQAQHTPSALASAGDFCVCPNGGTMCHVGGERVGAKLRDGGLWAAVPGGASNCQCCRFCTTTPAHLGGMVARLNALSTDVKEAGARLRAAEATRRTAVAARRAAADAESRRTLEAKVRRADAAVEAASAHALDVSTSWTRLFQLIERTRKVLQEHLDRASRGEGAETALVLNGSVSDLRAGLERCSDFDLWTRVCEDAEVYEGLPAQPAAQRRAARLDRILAAAGRPAVFAGLSDAELVAVGNAFTRWLRTRLGPHEAGAVVEGRRTLAEAGVLDEADQVLATGRAPVAAPALSLLARAPRRIAAGAPAGAPE